MSSALPLIATTERTSRISSFVPKWTFGKCGTPISFPHSHVGSRPSQWESRREALLPWLAGRGANQIDSEVAGCEDCFLGGALVALIVVSSVAGHWLGRRLGGDSRFISLAVLAQNSEAPRSLEICAPPARPNVPSPHGASSRKSGEPRQASRSKNSTKQSAKRYEFVNHAAIGIWNRPPQWCRHA